MISLLVFMLVLNESDLKIATALLLHPEITPGTKPLESEPAMASSAPCEKCAGKNIISLNAKASDNNYWTLPNGTQGEGYMPFIPAVTNPDGIFIELCIDCGWIVGFDSEAVKKAVAELTGEGEEHDDNDDEEEEEEEKEEEEYDSEKDEDYKPDKDEEEEEEEKEEEAARKRRRVD